MAALCMLATAMVSGCAPHESAARDTDEPTGHDLPCSDVRSIELPFSSIGKVKQIGDSLYVTVSRGNDEGDDLVKYEPADGSFEIVSGSDEGYHWFAASERWLVWQSGKSLYTRRVGSGDREIEIAKAKELIVYGADVEDDTVAWIDCSDDGDFRVMAMNLETGKRLELDHVATPGLYSSFVQVYEGRVLWTDIEGEMGVYCLYDLDRRTKERFELSGGRFRYPGYADIWKDRLFSINFESHGEWDWTLQEYGYLDTNMNKFVPVDANGYINGFCVCGDRVAVLDSKQQLLVAPAESPHEFTNWSEAVGAHFDQVDVAGPRVLAAWSSSATSANKTQLCLFTLE